MQTEAEEGHKNVRDEMKSEIGGVAKCTVFPVSRPSFLTLSRAGFLELRRAGGGGGGENRVPLLRMYEWMNLLN